jgi:hypothetical protein
VVHLWAKVVFRGQWWGIFFGDWWICGLVDSWQNYSWLSFYDFLNKYTWRELLAKLALKTPNLASKKIITRQIGYKICTFGEQ